MLVFSTVGTFIFGHFNRPLLICVEILDANAVLRKITAVQERIHSIPIYVLNYSSNRI